MVTDLLGMLIGVVLKKWKGCKIRTHGALALALAFLLLIIGKLLLDSGNYLGQGK